eukprot:TRINITY_DN51195_c0_g1_i1.p1 TRINITY_DN51195_c0_g1~~TRINITY_DN51195_c0_g1_i1.p1  ORF type:complete len:284 (+),score=35.11 TRINITY_DN51195_c0_g1_i1:83-934(+)
MEFFADFGSGSTTPGIHWLPGMLLFTILGTAAYHVVFFVWFRAIVHRVYSQSSFWCHLRSYRGMFTPDVQVEIQYISILGLHHLVGGGLMAYGSTMQSPQVWAAGALVGVWDDLHDLVSMSLPAWPFRTDSEAKRDIKLTALIGIHHISALLCTFPTLMTGLHQNPHVQAIGAWLLLAGGISCVALAFSRTLNRNNPSEAKLDAAVWLGNAAFYSFARFHVFPQEMFALFHGHFESMGLGMRFAMVAFAVLMGIFNLIIGLDALGNTLKRVRHVIALDEKSKN